MDGSILHGDCHFKNVPRWRWSPKGGCRGGNCCRCTGSSQTGTQTALACIHISLLGILFVLILDYYLKGQSHEIFCTRFFPPNNSSLSHQTCPRAVLIFFAYWLSYGHFKMTPRCPMYQGVETPRCSMYQGVETPQCPKYQGFETPQYFVRLNSPVS